MKLIVHALALVLTTSVVLANHDTGAPVRLRVFPPDVSLTSARDSQRVVVLATFADGVTRDVTSRAKLSVAGGAAHLDKGFVLRPKADGTATLEVKLGKLSAKTKITVKGASTLAGRLARAFGAPMPGAGADGAQGSGPRSH